MEAYNVTYFSVGGHVIAEQGGYTSSIEAIRDAVKSTAWTYSVFLEDTLIATNQ